MKCPLGYIRRNTSKQKTFSLTTLLADITQQNYSIREFPIINFPLLSPTHTTIPIHPREKQ